MRMPAASPATSPISRGSARGATQTPQAAETVTVQRLPPALAREIADLLADALVLVVLADLQDESDAMVGTPRGTDHV